MRSATLVKGQNNSYEEDLLPGFVFKVVAVTTSPRCVAQFESCQSVAGRKATTDNPGPGASGTVVHTELQ